ncbi:MAG: DEAD/DEAH box helicase [Victivallales bacterium]|nr:DEAD/DEAH box helicase [Victivallales bacterium]
MDNMEKFRALGISEATLAALSLKGFTEPSPIQAAAIPLLLQGEKDVIGQAQTGTGKTAAFGIPIIEKIIPAADRAPRALILTPTRELAIQIAAELDSIKGDKELEILPVYGGQAIYTQLRQLQRGTDIVVGTPGRVMDLMRRNALSLAELAFAVLDEADEMLNMGFVEDIEQILGAANRDKTMLMFSATMPEPIMNIARKFMREYEVVQVKQRRMTADLTDQLYFEVHREDKFRALERIIDMEDDMYALVFCRTKTDVDELTSRLQHHGYRAEALHGDISQNQRIKTIDKFRQRIFNLLIATDVAARGIDINDLSHVINFSLPQDTESYIHRVGRTARAGREGTAISFVTPSEFRRLKSIQRQSGAKIRPGRLPRPEEIARRRQEQLLEKISRLVASGLPQSYVTAAEQLLASLPSAEVAAALMLLNDERRQSREQQVTPPERLTALPDRDSAAVSERRHDRRRPGGAMREDGRPGRAAGAGKKAGSRNEPSNRRRTSARFRDDWSMTMRGETLIRDRRRSGTGPQ